MFQNASDSSTSMASEPSTAANRTDAFSTGKYHYPYAFAGSAAAFKPCSTRISTSSTQLSTAFQLRTSVLNSTKLGAHPLTPPLQLRSKEVDEEVVLLQESDF